MGMSSALIHLRYCIATVVDTVLIKYFFKNLTECSYVTDFVSVTNFRVG